MIDFAECPELSSFQEKVCRALTVLPHQAPVAQLSTISKLLVTAQESDAQKILQYAYHVLGSQGIKPLYEAILPTSILDGLLNRISDTPVPTKLTGAEVHPKLLATALLSLEKRHPWSSLVLEHLKATLSLARLPEHPLTPLHEYWLTLLSSDVPWNYPSLRSAFLVPTPFTHVLLRHSPKGRLHYGPDAREELEKLVPEVVPEFFEDPWFAPSVPSIHYQAQRISETLVELLFLDLPSSLDRATSLLQEYPGLARYVPFFSLGTQAPEVLTHLATYCPPAMAYLVTKLEPETRSFIPVDLRRKLLARAASYSVPVALTVFPMLRE